MNKSADIKQIIENLLAVLPDSPHDDDGSWAWCWEELSLEAQEKVLRARRDARLFLDQLKEER